MMLQSSDTASADPSAVLGKAATRAAALLGLSGAALARIIGTSEATVSRVARGQRGLDPASKQGQLAALLVHLYRSLDALVGTDEGRRRAWMSGYNDALNGVPKELIARPEGFAAAVAYLDGMRAPH